MAYIYPHTDEEDSLLRRALPVVRRLACAAQRRSSYRLELDDLESVASGAALDAIRRYDPHRARFLPFVSQRIRWALLAYVRRRWRRLDLRRGAPSGVALRFADLGLRSGGTAKEAQIDSGLPGTIAPGGDLSNVAMAAQDDPEEALARHRLSDQLRRALDTLHEPVRTLLRRHYYEGERLDAAARALGMSKHSAYRLHRDAVTTLRRRLTRESLDL
jgi:RNA polymerase sigma factor (sigma-70 family)